MSYKELEKSTKESLNILSKTEIKEFRYIMLKIKYSNINEKDKCEFLQQLLDSVMIAQKEGKTINEVLGTDDIQKYCNMILNEYRVALPKNVILIRSLIKTGYIILILLVCEVICNIIGQLSTGPMSNFVAKLLVEPIVDNGSIIYNFQWNFYYTLSDLFSDALFLIFALIEMKVIYQLYKNPLLEMLGMIVFIAALIIINVSLLGQILVLNINILIFAALATILFIIMNKVYNNTQIQK